MTTGQVAGSSEERVWKPCLAEIEEALVPAFIIEEFDHGRSTVFVPAAPTPFSGSIYILTPERVHPVDVPFTHAIKSLSRWGSGSKELVAAMKDRKSCIKRAQFDTRLVVSEHGRGNRGLFLLFLFASSRIVDERESLEQEERCVSESFVGSSTAVLFI
jgi:hypothetical protein